MWWAYMSAELGPTGPMRWTSSLMDVVVSAKEIEAGPADRGTIVSVPLAENRRYKKQERF